MADSSPAGQQDAGQHAAAAPRRVADFATFATLGVLGTTQDLARTVLSRIDGAEQELVAEETLCLVATTTARAAEVGLRARPALSAAAVPALLELPFTYRDYLIGGAMLTRKDASLVEASEEVYARLSRKRDFYGVHFPKDQFPGQHALSDKMALWMGRVSPPKLPETPQKRLEKLGLVTTLLTHLKLVLASARRHSREA